MYTEVTLHFRLIKMMS